MQKFLIDPLNEPVAVLLGFYKAPLRYIQLADDGNSLSLFSYEGKKGVCLASSDEAGLNKKWWMRRQEIISFEPALVINDDSATECLLCQVGHDFFIWYPERQEAEDLNIKAEGGVVVSTKVLSFLWKDSDSESKGYQHVKSAVLTVYKNGLLRFSSFVGTNETNFCYRVILPCASVHSCKFFRQESNSVIISVRDGITNSIYFFELAADKEPVMLGEEITFEASEFIDYGLVEVNEKYATLCLVKKRSWDIVKFDIASDNGALQHVHSFEEEFIANARIMDRFVVTLHDDYRTVHVYEIVSGMLVLSGSLYPNFSFEHFELFVNGSYQVFSLGLDFDSIKFGLNLGRPWSVPIEKCVSN